MKKLLIILISLATLTCLLVMTYLTISLYRENSELNHELSQTKVNEVKEISDNRTVKSAEKPTVIPTADISNRGSDSSADIVRTRHSDSYAIGGRFKSFKAEGMNIYADKFDYNGKLLEQKSLIYKSDSKVVDLLPNAEGNLVLYSVQVDKKDDDKWYIYEKMSEDKYKLWFTYDLVSKENKQVSGVGYMDFGDPDAYGMTDNFKWAGNKVNLISAEGDFPPGCGRMGYVYDILTNRVVEIFSIVKECPEGSEY